MGRFCRLAGFELRQNGEILQTGRTQTEWGDWQVLNSGRVGRFCRLAGSEFQTDGAMKLKKRSPKDFKLHSEFSESFSVLIEDLRVCDV